MSFIAPWFLIGLVVSVGPTLIHLLNKRRHRTVEWAAMEFLREAVRRNKKLVELRDLILLILRTLAILLFVLALAQPYWVSDGATAFTGSEPIHAIIVVDNSMSMGYAELDKTLLDVGKERAEDFIRRLPKGSEISIFPLCNHEAWHAHDVDSTKEDALDTLASVTVMDRKGLAADGAELALQAIRNASPIPTKRVVFISDLQRAAWSAERLREPFEELGDVQVVKVSPSDDRKQSNTWVAEFGLRDGIADAETEAVFLATIRHTGEVAQSRVLVQLKIDGVVRASRHIDVDDGAIKRLVFKHKFERAGTSGDPLFARARLELDVQEPLALDNFREVIVPVVEQVPVLFIDQYGSREQPRIGAFGETFMIRHLLAPVPDEEDVEQRPLITIRHRALDQMSRDDLKDARLVVVAGVKTPDAQLVTWLREYVEQGGQLFLAAGANFDPEAWQENAWLDGAGILPSPLLPDVIGRVPPSNATADDEYPKFRLAPDSVREEAIRFDVDDSSARALLTAPFFYKAIAATMADVDVLKATERERIIEKREWLRKYQADEREWARKERAEELSGAEKLQRDKSRERLQTVSPSWLNWTNPLALDEASYTVDALVDRSIPRVLAEYDNSRPFAIRRFIGKGRVLLLTSGLYPQWNNIAAMDSVLVFDLLLRDMLLRSLPSRTFRALSVLSVPVASADQNAAFTVTQPSSDEAQPLRVDPLGDEVFGIRVRELGKRGSYVINRDESDKSWMVFAVNGPSAESELRSFDEGEFFDKFDDAVVRWLDADEEISLAGDTFVGHDIWKILIWLVVFCLIGEMAFLAAPYLTAGKKQSDINTSGSQSSGKTPNEGNVS